LSENKSWKFIPIEEIPSAPKYGFYNSIIEDFLKTNHEIVKLDYSGFKSSKQTSIIASLKKAGKTKVRVIKRGKDIILIQLTKQEEKK